MLCDALPALGYLKDIATDTATTDFEIPIPLAGATGYVVKYVTVYDAVGDNELATIGVFTAAGGTGTTIVTNAALTGHDGAAADVSERTVIAPATTLKVTADSLYVRVGTASGTAGSTISVIVHGYALP